jgi:peptidoglycan/xylan/chitin deacetylase (PgdA/CDA1 family)
LTRALERLVGGAGAVGIGAGLAAGAGLVPGFLGIGAALVALGGIVGAVVAASSRPELELFGPSVRRGRHPGMVALTIDDGPHPTSTLPMLQALSNAGCHATFFVLADRVERHPELLRAMVAGGHEIGLHGLHHDPWLTMKRPSAGAAELRRAADILVAAGAPPPRWYRPPFGAVSPRVYAAVEGAGLTMAWCSVRTLDGVPIAPDTLRARCRTAVGTDVVLLHEGEGPTHALLGEILAEWESRGIRAGTLGNVMGADV